MRCVLYLIAFAFAAVLLAMPFGLDVRGNGPNPLGALVVTAMLAVGAYCAAGHSRQLPVFAVYGWAVSLAGVPFLLPGSNWADSISVWFIIWLCIAYVLITGLICRFFAWARHKSASPKGAPTTCRNCSYCLRGLTEPRCPECGTSFSAAALRADRENAAFLARLEGVQARQECDCPNESSQDVARSSAQASCSAARAARPA